MINFFRKIRYNLMEQNKTGKYLMYAIGEIILVVIGILIAIQLNSWKTEADENTKVLKYMDGLYSDLNQDYERIKELHAFYLKNTNSIQLLIKASNQDKVLSNDELGKMFNSILAYRKFINKKSIYLSLINDGFINKINNNNLINEIIIYYESPYLIWSTEIYGKIMESIDLNQSNIYDSRDGIIGLNTTKSIPKWQLTNEQYNTDYEKLVNSKWAINIFTNFLKQSNYIFNNLESYKIMNENLRSDIENYKNKG